MIPKQKKEIRVSFTDNTVNAGDARIQGVKSPVWVNIDGLLQERRNSSALEMELRLSCTNPTICFVWTNL